MATVGFKGLIMALYSVMAKQDISLLIRGSLSWHSAYCPTEMSLLSYLLNV